jgi:hypothetical protein
MKKLALIYASIFLIIFIINIYIDPSHLIKRESRLNDEKRIADILLAGGNAGVPKEKIGFDERLSRAILLKKKSADDSVIFGSSRVRYFSSQAFDEEKHFVDAMNAATLEDLLVFTYLREKYNLLPKRLYIALDPWMIEKDNSYTRLVQVAYPEYFSNAVQRFQFELPEGSARIYKNLLGLGLDQLRIPLVDVASNGANVAEKGFWPVSSGKLPFGGKLQISFDGWITRGTYNWAWRVLLNGAVVGEGNYMDNLQNAPSPHQPRTIVTRQLEARKGDDVVVLMAHANNNGNVVDEIGQDYKLSNLSVQVGCGDSIGAAYKNSTNCNGLLQVAQYRKFQPILAEMISPAYFQQSLRSLLAPPIEETECRVTGSRFAFIACNNGGVPWTDFFNGKPENDRTENIVRATDDGLVPLKLIDNNALKMLKQLTDFYVRNGTEVAYVLVPVHPFSYEKWKSENDSRGFIMAEVAYRKFARTNGIPIVGSYDPSVVGCKNTEFRDWVHPLPGCTNRIARVLKRLPSSSALHN